MASRSKDQAAVAFELRSASMTLVVLVLKTTDMAVIERELTARFADTPDMFSHDPVVIDVAQAEGDPTSIDWALLAAAMSRFNMVAVAVRGARDDQLAAALEAGLAEAPEAVVAPARPAVPVAEAASVVPADPPAPADAPAPAAVEAADRSAEAAAVTTSAHGATMIIDRPLRSGQQVYARGGDLVVLAVVNFGAEVIADGSIHVYAPLRGKAIAGARGNTAARIFSTCMEPELISIAGTYRTTDLPLPAEVVGKPAQIRLDGERLVFEPLA